MDTKTEESGMGVGKERSSIGTEVEGFEEETQLILRLMSMGRNLHGY